MALRIRLLVKCWMLLAFLSFLTGCSNAPPQTPTVAQQSNNLKSPPGPTPGGSAALNKPGFPLAGPSIPQPVQMDTAPAQTPPQASHNTRPVGPLGVRQVVLGLNDLRQAGSLLISYYTENQRWPSNDHELRDALREMPMVYKAILVGDYVFAPLKHPQAPAVPETVLIYEKLPDKAGNRLVLLGDGSVRRVSISEFNQLKLPPP
ncbi:MAG: hypothetical protein RMJ19_11345 [Gemmatales bacterium]|nr:hypothetical protein [Gemmatales bacterium]MCS7161056.1 hypothetical protein [Gemmatales bacterium]MDW8176259.1 hypothetical protein [Gemmatales bacterium]MDW8223115.1 hypothetical protein [Gemmatales bacterium]